MTGVPFGHVVEPDHVLDWIQRSLKPERIRPAPTPPLPYSRAAQASGGGGMAASASGSTSHGGTGSAWPVSPIPAHELPLIECPDHPDRKFVRFTAQTPANKGRNFFKCMKNARRPDACTWFMWEDKYYEYLVDNGFLDDFHMPASGATQAHAIEQPDARHRVTQAIHELQRRVSGMETDIAQLKQEQGVRRTILPVASGDWVLLVLSLNVLAVFVAIIVALKK